MPSFYNGKRFFLTYPRCELLPEQLAEFLGRQAPVAYYLIAREQHEDGANHLHACVEFTSIQRHDNRWLDFDGHHPNKQDPRKWEACKQYCKKDGNFIEGPQEELFRQALSGMAPSQIVSTFSEKALWFDYCISNKITHAYAEWYWQNTRPDEFTVPDGFTSNGILCPALKSYSYDTNRDRVLIMKGPSGCGKTTWAQLNAPKPALFVSHIDTLKRFKPDLHKSIIFDDVDFTHYPRTAQIHIADFDNARAIHVRYGVIEIPAGIYKIFTCNTDPLTLTDEAIRRRVRVLNVQ